MHTHASNSKLVEPLPEPERTLNRRLHRRNRRVPFEQRNNPPQCPRVVHTLILDINYFSHFLVTLQDLNPIDDEPMDTENEVVHLMMFPLSLTGEVKTWLDELNKGTIKTFADKKSARPSGSLPIFTQSGKSYDPPVNPNDHQNDSETPINFDSDGEDDEPIPRPEPKTPKPVKETPIPKPYKPKIPYPQRLRKEKIEAQYGKFLDMIRAVQINVPLVDVLTEMPSYGKFLKELVGKFTFPANFVILEMEEDSKVPLILGRPFLYTTDAVIRVKQKQLNIGVGTE
ncbi:reverse transcriptase domain-containing protein [Tanacetum coccineum]|uniref:Reverse transcriptase domain-containing protein n=1 Tax=Tanacetum coccineum TaxID=301880 RepID=A0ABQ5E6E3_9ASTR